MNREQLIRALRAYARARNLPMSVSKKQGKGSHYIVTVGVERTTLQSDLDVYETRRSLKQLKIDPAAL